MRIQDGAGSGNWAKVTSRNKLATLSTIQWEEHVNSVTDEQAFMFSTTGFIALTTTGTEMGMFYLKNTSTSKNLIISSVRTCGNVVQKVIFYKNPTGGTLISGASAGSATNLNFSSANAADATVYKGADGNTLTGGTHLGNHINHVGHSTVDAKDAIILGQNDSFGVTFEVASAGDVCVAVVGYFE